MPVRPSRYRAYRLATIAPSSLLFLALASGCNRSDREPSPAPSAFPAVTAAPPGAPADTVPAPTHPDLGASPAPKAEGTTVSACTTDADCRTYSDSCTICSCRPLGKNAPDPKCSGKKTTCLIDPCTGMHAICRKGACVLGGPGDASTASDPSHASDAAAAKDATGKDATSAAKSADAASSAKSDGAAAPSSSAPTKTGDAAAH